MGLCMFEFRPSVLLSFPRQSLFRQISNRFEEICLLDKHNCCRSAVTDQEQCYHYIRMQQREKLF